MSCYLSIQLLFLAESKPEKIKQMKNHEDSEQGFLSIESKRDLYEFMLLTSGDVSDPNAYVRTLEKEKFPLFRVFVWTCLGLMLNLLMGKKILSNNFFMVVVFFVSIYFIFVMLYGVFCHKKGFANFWINKEKRKYTTKIISERHAKKSKLLFADFIGAGLVLLISFVIRLTGG